MSEPRIVAVDPSSPILRQWHEVLRAAYTQGQGPMWWISLAHQLSSAEHPHPRRTRSRYAALDGPRLVGALELVSAVGDPAEPVQVELAVAPEAQGRGIGRDLASYALQFAKERGHSTLQTEVHVPGAQALEATRSGRFLRDQGFRVGNVEERLLLDLPWDGHGEVDPPSAEVRVQSWVGACPQRYELEWAALKQQMQEDHPVGDLTRSDTRIDVERMREDEGRMIERGWIVLRSMALLRDCPVGFTEMFLDAEEPAIVVQDSTLVDRAARGKGVGRSLKAANLHQLERITADTAAGARYVQTWTSQSNAPMLALNRQFGFRVAGTMHDAERAV